MSEQFSKSLKTLEASGGIEPPYTDLQSTASHNENNDVAAEKYQDKAGTAGEPDTTLNSDLTKENAASTGMDHGVQNAVQNTPLHNTTPGIILQGRWIILEERPDGCHIVLIEDDVFYLLRVLPYGGRGIAYFHAKAFAEHYGAQCGEWR